MAKKKLKQKVKWFLKRNFSENNKHWNYKYLTFIMKHDLKK